MFGKSKRLRELEYLQTEIVLIPQGDNELALSLISLLHVMAKVVSRGLW